MTGRDKKHPSRRSFLRSGGAIAATSLALPMVARRARAQSNEGRVVFAYPGGSNQTIFQQQIIPPFTKQTGIEVQYVPSAPIDTVAKIRAQRGTSGIDVCQLASTATYQAIDNGLLQAIDVSLVPNAANIDPKIPRDQQVLPYGVAGNCLMYSKKAFDAQGWKAPTAWMDLFDPRYAHHTGMYSINITTGIAILLQVAKDLTGDYNNLDPAFAKFRELRQTIYQFFTSPGAWETAMQQGDLWIAGNALSNARALTKQGLPVGVLLPPSGVPSTQVSMGLIGGTQHPKAAHMWINHLLSKDVQKIFLDQLGYNPAVTGVEVSADEAPFVPNPSQVWFPDWHKISQNYDQIVDRWQREVEG